MMRRRWVRRGDRVGLVVATLDDGATLVVAWGIQAAVVPPAGELVPSVDVSPAAEYESRYYIAYTERFTGGML